MYMSQLHLINDLSEVLIYHTAGKYRWLDRGSPWIAWIGDRYLSYPHEDMFHPPNPQPAVYCVVTAMTLTMTMTLTLATCISLFQHYQTRLIHSPPAVNYWAFPGKCFTLIVNCLYERYVRVGFIQIKLL